MSKRIEWQKVQAAFLTPAPGTKYYFIIKIPSFTEHMLSLASAEELKVLRQARQAR